MTKQHKRNKPEWNSQTNPQFHSAIVELDNLALAFSKGISVEIRKKKVCEINQEYKRDFFQQLFKGRKKDNFPLIEHQLFNKMKKIEEHLLSNHFVKVVDASFKNISRLVVGLGSEHVFETSLTLDYIWGIPYLPSSAVKGICKATAFWEIVSYSLKLKNYDKKESQEGNSQNEIDELTKYVFQNLYNEDIHFENNKSSELNDTEKTILLCKLIFGAQNFEGLLTFLDAYPQNLSEVADIFDLDVINSHYYEYYNNPENNPAGDWYNPQPVYFLTVKPGIEFKFCVFFDQFRAEKLIKSFRAGNIYSELIEMFKKDNFKFIRNIIETSLKSYGIGAKTRLGYGLFE
ncbi:type III-B CRISPR module RAMP protein Cmr6 [Caldicellulosiruptor morganii]|uniref:Type III-B CRISPR module RAMP protein Cmr6 n=1 Tax=Caldicellulosiruptor morganii TaxID=1387555 RepID=A0ABY7BQM5_9FIRM|nr:type III-B CRISPR module RAMP protein Cmr6 [Caldicellulosiruptor morganii]WAM33729.1 type III-B CRISPR module RAMP protein Cmr6 [Caldicellulosiruptor morganii]